MKHMNGHMLCAVDVETTGAKAGFNDMIQLCVLPLDENIKPHPDHFPFYMNMKPKRPENIDYKASSVHKLDMLEIIERGLDPYLVEDYFIDWFYDLNLGLGKKIAPLASNWIFDSGFIRDWLGPEAFDNFFHFHYRDTQVDALYANDRCWLMGESFIYGRIGLGDLAEKFGVVNEKHHDALQDCITTAAIYRKMCTVHLPITYKSSPNDEIVDEQDDPRCGSD
jgi:DNA polymerase III epsilon subunit-like protein